MLDIDAARGPGHRSPVARRRLDRLERSIGAGQLVEPRFGGLMSTRLQCSSGADRGQAGLGAGPSVATGNCEARRNDQPEKGERIAACFNARWRSQDERAESSVSSARRRVLAEVASLVEARRG